MPKKSVTAPKPARKTGIATPARRIPQEFQRIKKILLAKRRILSGDVVHMEDEALNKTGQETASQDISNFAELGSDNFEQEFTIGLIENETVAIREIDAAIRKIDAGTYGTCENCNKKIGKTRLHAIPAAKLCIECKRTDENQGGPF